MADDIIINALVKPKTDEQDLSKLQKELEKSIDKSFANGSKGWYKHLSGSNKTIARIEKDGQLYSAIFSTTKSGKRDKKNGIDFTGPLTVSQSNRLLQSGSEESYYIKRTQIEDFNRAKREELEIARQINEAKEESYKIDNKIGDTDKTPDNKKISSIGRLLNTFKRVGFYRIARNLFRLAEAGIGEGFRGLAEVSPEVSKTLSSLITSLQKISNSLVISIYPILELVKPLLEGIADVIGHIGESLSYLAFELGLTSHWFKLNSKYAKEFNQQMNKFSFDKFEALSSGQSDNGESMFEKMTGEPSSSLKNIVELLQVLLSTLVAIGISKIIIMLADGSLISTLAKIGPHLTTILTKISQFAPYFLVAYGLYETVKNIIDLIKNWKDMSSLERLTAILKTILYLLSTAALIIGIITKNAKLMAIGGIGILATTAVSMFVEQKANGGMVQTGSLFIAGEAGAELVTTMPSGQTGVTNVAQFKQAMLEALYEWGGGFGGEQGAVVLNLDGAEIARSKRFTGEMNRRNAGLNLR